jgi:hypothetical protein
VSVDCDQVNVTDVVVTFDALSDCGTDGACTSLATSVTGPAADDSLPAPSYALT